MALDMAQVFHMNGGAGVTSYARNCTIQKNVMSQTKPFVKAAMHDYLSKNISPNTITITIAELGCSSGPTALKAVSEIMDVAEARGRMAKFMLYLVDLPSNDFNQLFALLPSFESKLRQEKGPQFGQCFVAGIPRSFYERLFPNNTLNFVHCASSLHWLSQAPKGLDGKDEKRTMNNGHVYLSKTSSREVIDAYHKQFRKDFLTFLNHRSHELVSGGRMVLSLMGRKSYAIGPQEYFLDLISQALMSMVSQGLISEEAVDSCNFAYYAPCFEEIKQLIEEESSFQLDRHEGVDFDWDGGRKTREELDSYEPGITRGSMISKMLRAVLESVLEHHFGADILDELFTRVPKGLDGKDERRRIINKGHVYLWETSSREVIV